MSSLTDSEFAQPYIDGLVQERHNSSAMATELRLSCTFLAAIDM